MYNSHSNPNRRSAPNAYTPPLGVFYQACPKPKAPGMASAFGGFLSALPHSNVQRLKRPAADDAVVKTPHWG